jgi:hypothetical protein
MIGFLRARRRSSTADPRHVPLPKINFDFPTAEGSYGYPADLLTNGNGAGLAQPGNVGAKLNGDGGPRLGLDPTDAAPEGR